MQTLIIMLLLTQSLFMAQTAYAQNTIQLSPVTPTAVDTRYFTANTGNIQFNITPFQGSPRFAPWNRQTMVGRITTVYAARPAFWNQQYYLLPPNYDTANPAIFTVASPTVPYYARQPVSMYLPYASAAPGY